MKKNSTYRSKDTKSEIKVKLYERKSHAKLKSFDHSKNKNNFNFRFFYSDKKQTDHELVSIMEDCN
jgi:hypothetical protein